MVEAIRDLMSNQVPDAQMKAQGLRILEQLSVDDAALCYECGKCTSGCPAFLLKELMPHKIMGLLNLGFVDEMINGQEIWACTICLRCKDRCPQNVSPVDVIWGLRAIATQRGIQNPHGFNVMLSSILERGIYQDPQEVMVKDVATKKKGFVDRAALGLPPASTPKDKGKFMEALMSAMQEQL